MAFRSQFTNLLQADMYGWLLEAYDKFTPVYPQIFNVQTMTGGFDRFTTGIGLGQLSERKEGDTIVASNPLEGYTIYAKARTFSDSFFLTAEFVKDTPPEKIANVMRAFAATWAEGVIASKETFAAKFFKYGGFTAGNDVFNNTITGVQSDPTGDLIYDGKPFFALSGNNHPAKDGNTYYNSLGAVSLSAPNIQTAYSLMANTNNRDEKGEIIRLVPDVLVIPPALRFTARQILETTGEVGTGNNTINPAQGLVTPIVWQYLSDTDAWFLGVARKGLTFYERQTPEIDFYQDEKDKKFYATIDARWGATVDNWRYWVASNVSTS